MKKLLTLILISLLSAPIVFGQSIVEVAETTLKVAALGEEVFYYGFAEGDQLIFSYQELNGKELKELEILEFPSSSKFMDYKTAKIEGKILNINRTGIYQFRLSNSALSGRVCKIKIQRIPGSDLTKKFNSSVYWKSIQDTTFTAREERYLVKSDTTINEVYSSNPQISSQTALNGNKNHQVVDFELPNNTVAWSFYIGTGNAGSAEYDNARSKFIDAASSLSKMAGYGPLGTLALTGVSYFSRIQGDDNVKYWFLGDIRSVNLFSTGQVFSQYKKGDVINEASRMTFPLKGKVYLALLNDNTVEPIKVTIRVAAVQVIQEWALRTVQDMRVANKQEPYLKN